MPGINFTIQKYQPTDLNEIYKLFYDTVHTINIRDYTQEQVNAWAPEIMDYNRWAHNFANHIAYTVKTNGTIVGFGDATEEGSIEHIYTHKDYQGKGIASAILKRLEEELQKRGNTQFTTQASITAKPFFEKKGYVVVNKQELFHHSGIIFTNYVMQKK